MTRVTTASALALAALAGPFSAPALAEVTPAEVWQDLETYLQSFGYEVSAVETPAGDTLTVTDFSVTFPIPEEDMVFTLGLPDLIYSDNGDGTVSMTIPAESTMRLAGGPAGQPPEGTVVLAMSQDGFAVDVSGEVDATTYAYSAERIALRLVELISQTEDIPPDAMRFAMELGPLEGVSASVRAGGLQTITQALSYGTLSFDFSFEDPDSDDRAMVRATQNGLTAEGELVIPMNADFEDPTAVFAAGLSVDALVSQTGGSTEFDVSDSGDTVTGQFTSEGSEISVAMSQDSMLYAVSSMGQSLQMMVPDLPFPVAATIGEIGLSMEVPLQPSETPQSAGLAVLLSEFTMADSLWNIFDPGQMLPREPATVAANLQAEVTPFVSLLDQEQMDAVEASGGVPGELNALTLTDLVVRAVGAEVTGEGAFTFDNSDLESFDGMPRPEGAVNFEISGINGLIDTLINMGLVQEQDAMGARMMMGMFTVPGSAPDTATSVIEINDQGHILANGQRIQ